MNMPNLKWDLEKREASVLLLYLTRGSLRGIDLWRHPQWLRFEAIEADGTNFDRLNRLLPLTT
ncbi:hypothetical protein Taro_022364 [Colocasia esculenta]|uniref:Uncharacterized protein n=1 Tax=Colocasia esculenta TaxID=4460 RepID=A0A843VB45_COLES|nr:hypothetical protein [Colocasia esculenta]